MSLYSPDTDPKYQAGEVPVPDNLPPDVIVSEDTRRHNRVPPGQTRTRKWPVLHAATVPEIDINAWQLTVTGLVEREQTWTLPEFRKLPRTRVFGDFHCVTTWSRLGNLWEGVLVRDILHGCGICSEARFAIIGGFDNDWTTNLPLDALLEPDVLLADTHDGLPLDPDHGGPVRLIVPKLFAWKSAKWLKRIELTAENHPGYWELAGYHNVGDPWREQRYRDDPEWLAQRNTDRNA